LFYTLHIIATPKKFVDLRSWILVPRSQHGSKILGSEVTQNPIIMESRDI
jgi:hypothetical protein